MSNTKSIAIIYKGEVVDFQGVNTTTGSKTVGYTGQLFDGKTIHVACCLGLCKVKMVQYNNKNAVEVTEIVVPFEKEKADCMEKQRGKYVTRVFDIPTENMVCVEYFNISTFVNNLLIKCKLNTQSPYYIGRTLKSLTGMLFEEKATHTIKMTYDDFLKQVQESVKESDQNRYNLGVIAERVILKARKAFTERERENDGYYNGKPVELKTNFSAKLRQFLAINGVGVGMIEKSSGTSQSNLLVKYAPKKGYTVR